ncbi:MAG: hypothetical protein ACM3US_07040 [Sphingomonadaceae bacterium]
MNSSRRWLVVAGVLLLVVGLTARLNAGLGGFVGRDDSAPVTRQEGGADDRQAESAQPTPESKPAAVLTLPSGTTTQWEHFTFSAEGFEPGETVSLLVDHDGEPEEIGQATADGEGRISDARVQLPSWLESGNRTVQAVGGRSGTSAGGTLHIRAKDLWANLNSYNHLPAGRLGFVAGGFEPGDRVSAFITQGDGTSVAAEQALATATADDVGNTSWTEVEIPVLPPGEYNLVLKGEATEKPLSTAITIEPLQPQMELSPWSGLPGSSFDVNAKGFLPNEEVELLLGSATAAVSTYRADQYGGVWGAGPIDVPPDSKSGALVVGLRGRSSGATAVAEYNVVGANPWLELSSYSGFAGSPVTASGGGFAAGERITLHLGEAGGQVVAEGVAALDGSYRGLGPVTTPTDAAGQVTLVVVGESSGTQATATFKIVEPFQEELPAP